MIHFFIVSFLRRKKKCFFIKKGVDIVPVWGYSGFTKTNLATTTQKRDNIMTNLEIFNSDLEFNISLSDSGKEFLTDLIKSYTNIDPSETDLNAWFDTNNPDSDGDFMNEIPSRLTKDGRPHTFTLDIENDFVIELKDA